MFTIYTLQLGQIIKKHSLSYHIYADDTQIYTTFNPKDQTSINNALSSIASCITEIKSWMTKNCLKLNEDKTEFLVLGSPHSTRIMPTVELNIGDSSIKPTTSVRNLGVLFDSNMSMSVHIANLRRNISFHLRNMSRIRRFLDYNSCHHVARALILSRLDYGNSLLFGSNESDLNKLQSLQNWAARLVCGGRKRDSASPLLKELHWLPLRQRIIYKLCVHIYKCINDTGPIYLNQCIAHYEPGRPGLRSGSDRSLLVVQRTKNSAADKSFTVAGPKLWNDLPNNIRLCESLQVFKKQLKTHLFPT